MDNPKYIIELKNISLIYDYVKGERALDIKELKISCGENTVILGPNGSGKSTLISLIIHAKYPEIQKNNEESVLKVFGQENWDIFDLKNLLGIITPDLQSKIIRDITVYENILSGFFSSIGIWKESITAKMEQKALETLEFLGLKDLKNRKLTEVSTGEARLALIARALVHNPKAMILDEPTSGLDMVAAQKFRKLLSKISKAKTSIILVTHDLEDIIPEIKRAILLKDGKVIKDGPIDKVLTETNLTCLYNGKITLNKTNDAYSAKAI